MKVLIEITDAPDGTVDIQVEFDPPLTEETQSPAAHLALWGIEEMQREAARSRENG